MPSSSSSTTSSPPGNINYMQAASAPTNGGASGSIVVELPGGVVLQGGGKMDPFDLLLETDDWNSKEWINKVLPTEKSLHNLDQVSFKLDQVLLSISGEVKNAIHEHGKKGFPIKEELEEIKSALGDLFKRIKSVQNKTEQSNTLVQEFCRNIKFLDLAKKNLTNTVTGFKRFVMLVTALEQLRRLAQDRKYQEVAQLLSACEELATHFSELGQVVPKVGDLLRQKDDLLKDLKSQIFEDYDCILTDPGRLEIISSPKRLEDSENHVVLEDNIENIPTRKRDEIKACSYCVDALPVSVRHEIITRFCLKILEEYKLIFQPNVNRKGAEDYGSLENVERRYAWLRRLLIQFDDRYLAFFPSSWEVPCAICEHFCHLTRQHLVEILGVVHHTVDPELLVRVLKKSIDFESDLAKKYTQKDRTVLQTTKHICDYVNPDGNAGMSKNVLPHSFKKYSDDALLLNSSRIDKKDEENRLPRFRGIISECFECYLGTWVKYEAENLKKLIPSDEVPQEAGNYIIRDDDDEEEEDSRYVFPSAPLLFDAMKKIMLKAASFNLSTIMLDIFNVFKSTLQIYAGTLSDRIRKMEVASSSMMSSSMISSSMISSVQVMSSVQGEELKNMKLKEEIKTACAIIGTLEYVDSTLPQLLENFKAHISFDYHHQLDLDDEQEVLGSITSLIYLDILVHSLEVKLEPIIQQISNIPWYNYRISTTSGKKTQKNSTTTPENSTTTPENSSTTMQYDYYVEEIDRGILEHFTLISSYLSKLHYRYFCDKCVQWFIPRFLAEIYRCKKINRLGAEQLLIDTKNIKTILLETPLNATQGQCTLPTAYSNYVIREMRKVEFLFRVLSEEEDALRQIQENMNSSNNKEVERILSLKASQNMTAEEMSMWDSVNKIDQQGNNSNDNSTDYQKSLPSMPSTTAGINSVFKDMSAGIKNIESGMQTLGSNFGSTFGSGLGHLGSNLGNLRAGSSAAGGSANTTNNTENPSENKKNMAQKFFGGIKF